MYSEMYSGSEQLVMTDFAMQNQDPFQTELS